MNFKTVQKKVDLNNSRFSSNYLFINSGMSFRKIANLLKLNIIFILL